MSLRPRLLTLIAVRVVASTLLLGWAMLIQLSRPGSFPVDPFFFLIGLTYGLSVVYLATLRFAEDHGWLVDVQFGADAILVSAFIHVTGGITSYFSSLYVLPIIAASTIRFGRGAMQVATLSAVLYLALVTAQYVPHDYLPASLLQVDASHRSAVAALRAVHRRHQPVRVLRRGVAVGIAGRAPRVRGRAARGRLAPDRGPPRVQRVRHRQPAERPGQRRCRTAGS